MKIYKLNDFKTVSQLYYQYFTFFKRLWKPNLDIISKLATRKFKFYKLKVSTS